MPTGSAGTGAAHPSDLAAVNWAVAHQVNLFLFFVFVFLFIFPFSVYSFVFKN
jgi:hypothetical protein